MESTTCQCSAQTNLSTRVLWKARREVLRLATLEENASDVPELVAI